MSEVLRDLVVTLSLNSDNFTRNIKSVNRQIQEAQSEFRLATSGMTGFESKTQTLAAKASTLSRQVELQKSVVDQYQKALAVASNKLQECYDRQNEYADRLKEAQERQQAAAEEVRKAADAYENYKNTLGETDSATLAAKANLEAAQQDYADISKEVEKLEGQETALTKATQNAADAFSQAQTRLNDAQAALNDMERDLATAQSSWTKLGTSLSEFGKGVEELGEKASSLGKTLTASITTPIIALGTTAVKESIEFESAFASVRKTTDATEEQFKQLETAVSQMSTEIAASTSEISEVMAYGGQLGIATEYLADFTRVMIDLDNSCEDLDATEAATTLAQFANIMGTDQSKFQNIGSTLVELGNNFATTESPIMEMAQRLAGAGKQVGLTEAQILGFSAALSSVGISAEMGGSAFSKALTKMEVASATGGEALNDFATVSGMTADEFKALWDTDPASAFMAFIEGLAKMDDEGISAIATLQEIGMSEVRLRDTMLRSTNATELFRKALNMADEAWEENSALATEAGKRYATTESQLTNLKNKASLLATAFGDDLNPTIKNVISGASDFLDKLLEMDSSERLQIINMAAIAASIGPIVLLYGKITTVVGKAASAIGSFALQVGAAGGGWTGLTRVIKGSPALMAATTTAVVALSAAVIYGAYQLYDYASGAKAAREAIEGLQETADNWKNSSASTYYNGEGLSYFGLDTDSFINGMTESGASSVATVQDWLDGMIDTWTDGKVETDAIVKEWQDSNAQLSADARASLVEMRDEAEAAGNTAKAAEIDADIAALDAVDKRISTNLEFFQNSVLTDSGKTFWQNLANEKEAILLKWGFETEPVGGNTAYDQIAQKVAAAEARAKAMGQDVSADLYEEANLAAAEGYAAVIQNINDEYDAEYASIMQLSSAQERNQRLTELDAQYAQQRAQAARDYADSTTYFMEQVYNSDTMQKTKSQMTELYNLLQQYANTSGSDASKSAILTQIETLTSEMDEGELTEYLTTLTQIASLMSSGMTNEEVSALFPDINVDDALAMYAAIGDYLDQYKSLEAIKPLAEMFNEAVPEEIITITADLNLEAAKAAWEAFAANPGSSIMTEAYITGASTSFAYDAFRRENSTLEIAGVVKFGRVTEEQWDTALGLDGVKYYNENGIEIPATAIPAGQLTTETLVAVGTDGTLHVIVTPEADEQAEIVIPGKVKLTGYDAQAYADFQQAYGDEITITGRVTVGSDEWERALNDGNAMYYDAETGLRLAITPEVAEKLTAEDIALVGEDGTVTVLVTPKVTGTQEAVEETREAVETAGTSGLQRFLGISAFNDYLRNLRNYARDVEDTSGWWFGLGDVSKAANEKNVNDFVSNNTELMAAYQAYYAELLGLINQGGTVSDEDLTNLNEMIQTVQALQSAGIGESFVASIADGLGISSEELLSTLQSAWDAANAQFEPEVDADAIGASVGADMHSAGTSAVSGFAQGINDGSYLAVNAMRNVAMAAVKAAKLTLDIHSPSRVFRDEVGAMAMKGFSEGIESEAKAQAGVIRNASRYLTQEAGDSALAATNDNRKTYNTDNSTSFSFAGAQFTIRGEQDIHDLATEIAALTKRTQRGRGNRFA